jgi:hypothetical protein
VRRGGEGVGERECVRRGGEGVGDRGSV